MAGERYKEVLQAEISGEQKSQSFQRLRGDRVVSLHPLQSLIALGTATAQSTVREIDGHVRADAGTREGFRSVLFPAASAISSKERSLVAWS
jgi:hypothetical protein